jgi:predicted PurR-regulated permease PerM
MTDSESRTEDRDFSFFLRRVVMIIIVVAITGILLWVTWASMEVLLIIFTSVLFAVGIRGLNNWISQRLGTRVRFSPTLMLTLTVVTLTIVFGLLLWLAFPRVSFEVDELQERITGGWKQIEQTLSQYEWGRQLLASAPSSGQILARTGEVVSGATGIFSGALSVLTNLVLVLFIGLYLAFQPDMYINGAIKLVPRHKQARAREILGLLGYKLQMWLLSRIISMVLIGVLTLIGLALIGVPFAVPLSIFAGLINFIPMIGPFIAAIPAIIVGLTQSPQQAINVVILYLVIQALDNYIVTPVLSQKAVDMPAALVMATQLIFGVVAGFMGVMLAAPLTVVVMVLVNTLYVQDTLGNRPSEAAV